MSSRRPLTPHAELHLRDVLQRFPGTRVTSSWRTVAENRRVGGAPRSFHLTGRAADLVPARGQWGQVFAYLAAQRVSRRCTGPEELIHEGDHIHVAW